MRTSFVTYAVASVVAASFFAASAFNYADLNTRTLVAEIVTDENAYLAIWQYDTDYDCYVGSTNGKIDIQFDAGTSCGAGGGTGLSPDSDYYFHDVLLITNKGTKSITNIWLNSSLATMELNINSAAGTMKTADTYAQEKTISSLAVGSSYYIGFHFDATGLGDSDSLSGTLSIEARTTQ